MRGCPGGECMLDAEGSCRWRLLCHARDDELVEREFRAEIGQRIAEELGRCRSCGLDVVRLKGSQYPTHVVPVLPIETRAERVTLANAHRPRPGQPVSE